MDLSVNEHAMLLKELHSYHSLFLVSLTPIFIFKIKMRESKVFSQFVVLIAEARLIFKSLSRKPIKYFTTSLLYVCYICYKL